MGWALWWRKVRCFAVEADEKECEHEDDKKRAAEEADDKTEVGTVGGVLFNIHEYLDAKECDHVGGRESNVAVRALRRARLGR